MAKFLPILFSLMVLAISGRVVAGGAASCPKEPMEIYELLELSRGAKDPLNQVPGTLLVLEMENYLGPCPERMPEEARRGILGAILRMSAGNAERNLKFAEEHCWPQAFQEDLRAAIVRKAELEAMTGEEVYSLAQDLRRRNESPAALSHAESLVILALKKKYPPAILEASHARLAEGSTRNGGGLMRAAADEGYEPALREIVSRLIQGRDLPPDPLEAYFWARRGQWFGFDFSSEIAEIEDLLDQAEEGSELHRRIEEWIERAGQATPP